MTFAKKGHSEVPDLPGRKLIDIPADHMHSCNVPIDIAYATSRIHTLCHTWHIHHKTGHIYFVPHLAHTSQPSHMDPSTCSHLHPSTFSHLHPCIHMLIFEHLNIFSQAYIHLTLANSISIS